MHLYFLRHGPAGSKAHWSGHDEERPLTEDGRAVVLASARLLARTEVAIDAILTSPLVRARQTAEIAAAELDAGAAVDDSRLAPGFNRKRLTALLADHRDVQAILLVGHETDFSSTIRELTGGTVVCKKGGIARVDIDEGTMRGELVWLLPPMITGLEP
jgi:phosphohistidine phosphatase